MLNIDEHLIYTPHGRVPCLECTLKHLGAAWFLTGLSRLDSREILLSRVEILLFESANGYPDHRVLAIGILAVMETSCEDTVLARNIRRAIHSKQEVNIWDYPKFTTFELNPMLRVAHLIEAEHESPIPLDTTQPIKLLVEQVFQMA